MEGNNFCCYEFGEFKLDARRRSLFKDGEKVPLPARNFDLLLFMVENGGRILEHDELLDKVWAGTFVEQATLKKGISALRQILAEKPESEFIKTIPRRGYSFVSPVRVVPEENEFFYVRETEQEIIVEEYEETDDENKEFDGKAVEIPATELKSLPVAAPKKINFTRTAILCAGGIVTLLLVFFGLKPYFSKPAQPQFSVENVQVSRITNTGKIIDAMISPDGIYLIYSADDKDGVSLWLRQMSANSLSRLTTPMNVSFWGFSFAPDNSHIYYITHNKDEPQNPSGLYKIPLLGGEPRRLYEDVSSVLASPDGKTLALVRLNDKSNIFTVNTDGENERTIAALPGDLRLLGLAWTPDGTALLATIRRIVEEKPQYYIAEISLESGRETIILPPQEKVISGAFWLPDRSAVMMMMREPNGDVRQIWQYLPDSAEWRRVTNDNNSYKAAYVTRDGKTIMSKQESRLASIWVTSNLPIEKRTVEKKSLLNNSDNFKQITDGINNYDWLGWTADNRVMFSTTEDRQELIFTINRDGTSPRQITGGEDGIWMFPSVTGNGHSICFLSSRTGLKQVWRIDEDGKNLTQITRADSPVSRARILHDNTTVLYTAHQPNGVFLFKQTAAEQTTQLTEVNTGSFAVSPDEKLLAVETIDKNTGKYRVELRSLGDGQTIIFFDFTVNREINFTPDGKNLAYDARHGEFDQIMIQPLDGGESYALTDFQTDNIFSFGWSPDGTHLAVIRGKPLSDAVLIKAGIR